MPAPARIERIATPVSNSTRVYPARPRRRCADSRTISGQFAVDAGGCKRWTKAGRDSAGAASDSRLGCARRESDEVVFVGRGPSVVGRSIPPREVVSQQLSAVLVLVAVDAEILPVAAVGRIVAVIAVFVMHGQQVEGTRVELSGAFRTDLAVQSEGAFAVAGGALAGLSAALADQRGRVDEWTPATRFRRSEAAGRHARRVTESPSGGQPGSEWRSLVRKLYGPEGAELL